MTLLLNVDGTDVVVRVGDPDVTVAEMVQAIAGRPGGATPARGGRPLPPTQRLLDAAIRPGDELACHQLAPVPVDMTGMAVHVIAGVDGGRAVPMGASELSVGRDRASGVRLASNGVSKHHCTLRLAGDHVLVRDEGSRNGTVVRGRRIGTDWVEVDIGEPFRCGPAVLVVRAVPITDAPAAVANLLGSAPSGSVPFYRSPIDLAPDPAGAVPAGRPPPASRRPPQPADVPAAAGDGGRHDRHHRPVAVRPLRADGTGVHARHVRRAGPAQPSDSTALLPALPGRGGRVRA
ncbi:MAG: FHA domain-containing protein [Acidimicrobiales bacterium]